MNKNFFLIISLFFVVLIISACEVGGKVNTFTNANIGTYVKFGSYPQTANDDIQPIEWQVLSKKENKMLLLSKYGLEARHFDTPPYSWKNSEVRQWLNNDFYNKAFTENDKKNIKSFNGDNVFLLNKKEIERYFAKADSRKCKATEYAVKNGADVATNGYSWWWLRSPSPEDGCNYVYCVSPVGDFFDCSVEDNDIVFRPALWIKI